jgi:hypothetical protein
MRLAALFAASAILGLAAHADGVSRRSLDLKEAKPLEATEASAAPMSTPPGHEAGIYRHGATYAVLAGDTALSCEAACGDDGVCQAWSFVEAYGASGARCELKQGGGKAEENLLATSGVSPRIDAVVWGVSAPAAEETPDVLVGEAEIEPLPGVVTPTAAPPAN